MPGIPALEACQASVRVGRVACACVSPLLDNVAEEMHDSSRMKAFREEQGRRSLQCCGIGVHIASDGDAPEARSLHGHGKLGNFWASRLLLPSVSKVPMLKVGSTCNIRADLHGDGVLGQQEGA